MRLLFRPGGFSYAKTCDCGALRRTGRLCNRAENGLGPRGRSVLSRNPVLQTQFEVDRTACLGERNKAALSGVTVAGGGLAGAIAAQERTNAADTVGQGCMAEKGYLLVKEDEADAKRAELARLLN